MKRIGVLFLFLLILSGCGNAPKEIERGMALRSKILKGTSCSFDAEVIADYGDKVHTFSMKCQANTAGDIIFTVTAPETIAGISGSISEEGGKLTFDDTGLQFELMADDQVTPISAPWIFLKTIRSGYLTSACIEEDQLRLTIDDSYEEDALQLDIWLNSEDIPVRVEILYDGYRIVSLNVENFTVL